MHTVRLIAFLLAVAASAANGQQIAADSSYKITLMINGVAVKGSQKLGPLIKNEPVAGAVFDANPPMELARGKSYQAKVLVTDSSGQPRDYTRNARLR